MRKRAVRTALRNVLLIGVVGMAAGCTPEEMNAWLAWHDADPESAIAWIERPEVAEDLTLDANQDGELVQAERLAPPPPPVPTGLNGLPFASGGLSDCAEMMFYANQVGLPGRFEGIGWRESNCRNEDGVHTSCCWGYWQLHRMHLPKPQCDAWSASDINSDDPLEKQRQACVAKALYDAAGLSPWSATT